MNDCEIFRRLVSNELIPNINYRKQKFSFQTVCYQSASLYRMCECAFENEYLDYISKSGEINDEIYFKILQNITNGKCPHVEKVNEKYKKETSIYAIHIAVAVGTEQPVMDYLNDCKDVTGEIFEISPYRLALLRENIFVVNLFQKSIPHLFPNQKLVPAWNLLHAQRIKEHKSIVRFESISAPELCVRTKNRKLLHIILNPSVEYQNIATTFGQAINYDLTDIQTELLDYICSVSPRNNEQIDCAEYALLYNQPSLLYSMLQILNSSGSYIPQHLSRICSIFDRPACTAILKAYGITDSADKNYTLESQVHFLLRLLTRYGANSNKDSLNSIKKSISIREIKLNNFYVYFMDDPRKCEVVHALGADGDFVSSAGETILTTLLSPARVHIHGYKPKRETLELLLYENLSFPLNQPAIRLAFELDELFEKITVKNRISGDFKMDCKEHSQYGYEGAGEIAMSFYGPLLLECGFPVTKNTLVAALDKSLHGAEHDYILGYLNSTRPLKILCRDVIRKHFKRRELHWFVETVDMPKKIKDFLLLKDILLNIDK